MSAPGPGSMYSPRNARLKLSSSLLVANCSQILESSEKIGRESSFFTRAATRSARLFGKDRVRGIPFTDAANHKRFALFIRDGHKIRSSFEFDLLVAAHVVLQDVAGRAGEINREVQLIHW